MDRAIAASGVLVAVIDLRLSTEAPYPASVLDANYGSRATLASSTGRADVVDGIDMLIAQARVSFAIWQGEWKAAAAPT